MNFYDFNPNDLYRLILGLAVVAGGVLAAVWAQRGNHNR
jgi:hypothetical protein